MPSILKAPFPYFGGKRKVASLIWERFGKVSSYVEPFFGSGAVLLGRPLPFEGVETVNDADGLLANVWRSLKADPEATAYHADHPVNENDLHARHAWLVGQKDSLQARLEGDPEYYDPKIAGWWLWGIACWIGSGFCSGEGPWQVVEGPDGSRQLVHLGDAGQGVNRQLVHLGDAGRGVNRKREELTTYFAALADRLRDVRVCCGDWTRVMGDTPMFPTSRAGSAVTAVFLDPPYADTAKRQGELYRIDCESVAHAVREWAIRHGDDPRYRICVAGFEGEHVFPESWDCVKGRSGQGHGYGGQTKDGYENKGRERLWFSPHCISNELPLFAQQEAI
jgi:DNA adenine methylase